MHLPPTSRRSPIALACTLILGALLAYVPAAASPVEHTDSWREQALSVPGSVARAAGLPAGRYALGLAPRQPADGSIRAVLLRDGRPDPERSGWSGRPSGCAPGALLAARLSELAVGNQPAGAGGAGPLLLLRARIDPPCSLLLAPGIEGSDIGSGGASAPVPGIEGSPIGTAGTAAPGPGIEGSDIGSGGTAAPVPGIEGTDVSTGVIAATPTDIAGVPPSHGLRKRVEAVLAAARDAQGAFPPHSEIAEELRPVALQTMRSIALLATTPAADPRLVQKRLETVEAATPKLMQACANGRNLPTGEVGRCVAVSRECWRACDGGGLCTCAPDLAGCLGRVLAKGGR